MNLLTKYNEQNVKALRNKIIYKLDTTAEFG